MSDETYGFRTVNNSLYKVPTISEYTGELGFVYVDPFFVNNVRNITIQVSQPEETTQPRHHLEVTEFYSGTRGYNTPLSIEELGQLLELGLIEQQAANV